MLASSTTVPTSTIDTKDGIEMYPLRARLPSLVAITPAVSLQKPLPSSPSSASFEEFLPMFIEHATHTPMDNNALVGFDISSSKGYYAVMRTVHYFCEALTPVAASCIGYLMNNTASTSPDLAKAAAFSNFDNFLKVESLGLTLMAGHYLREQYQHLKNDIAPALALEFGKHPDDIGFMDMMQSKNPIISIEMHRFMARAFSRMGASIPFAFGLPQGDGMDKQLRITPGLMGVAANIWLERTAFYAKTPYDFLTDNIIDVQNNVLGGDTTVQQTTAVFQRALQGMYQHRGRQGLTIEEMEALHPLLLQAAQDVSERKVGVDTMIAVIGGGILVPDNIEQSTKNYAYIRDHGMDAAIQSAIEKRASCPESTNIWEQTTRSFKQEDLSDTPISAQPDQVYSARERAQQREYFNAFFRGPTFGI